MYNPSITTNINLQRGLRLTDKLGRQISYRYVQPGDDIDLITAMLHEAYAPLAEQGLRFVATHQDSDTTWRRMSRGETILALDTSEHAAQLIALYKSKGYSFVEYVRWPDVNYRSMIFARALV